MKNRQSIDQTFAALADPTRRAVIDLLKKEALRAGQLAQQLGISAPALSRHLRVLRRGGLVMVDDATDDDARVRRYRLRPEALEPLRDWLIDLEQFWAEQLQGFANHVAVRKRTGRCG